MTASDFVKYYEDVTVGYFIDTYVNNFIEVNSFGVSDTSTHTYNINVPHASQISWIGVEFYNPRMYTSSSSC